MSEHARILVVEDEPLSRDMLVRRLGSRSFEVVGVQTARAAIDYLKDNAVDLVLMDNDLPGMTGTEAVRELRQNWSHDALPVIMVSALIDSDDVVDALDAGANDYVVKPINFKVLMARISTALRMRANVAALVEAERQRVVMESLARAAATVAEPLEQMVDELESLMEEEDADRERLEAGLERMLDLTDRAVDVIDQLRKIAAMRNVPYTARIDFLGDIAAENG
jgi:DNA-binding response OmpR family regulator